MKNESILLEISTDCFEYKYIKNLITFQDVEDTSFFIVLSMRLQIRRDRLH